MDTNLKGIKPRRDQPYVKKQFQPAVDPYLIDIATINSNGFYLSMYRPDNEVFSTSLYEIDRILEDREEEEADVDSASAEGPRMPAAYSEYEDVGSKAALDVLPLY